MLVIISGIILGGSCLGAACLQIVAVCTHGFVQLLGAYIAADCTLSDLLIDAVGLGEQVEIIGVRQRSALENDLVVLHQAYHNVIVCPCIEKIGRSDIQWSENVWTHSHGNVVRCHAVLGLVFDDFSHEVHYELECDTIELRKLPDEFLQFVDSPLGRDVCQTHVRIILIEWAYWVLHLSH